MRESFRLGAAAAALSIALFPQMASAAGAAPRAWISSSGVDAAGCGGFASPCHTFQYTLDNIVAPGATISVNGAGTYGPAVISHAVTILAEGGVAEIFAASGDAIDIQAPAGNKVFLRGLSLVSAGGGTNGVNLISAGQVVIENCVITGFHNGVAVTPSSGQMHFTVAHSTLVSNVQSGVAVTPSGSASVLGAVTQSDLSDDENGIFVEPSSASATAYVMVNESTVNSNLNGGISSANPGATISITKTLAIGNGDGAGIFNGNLGVGKGSTYDDNRVQKSLSGSDTFGLTTLNGN
jgi:hypothetical protein